MDKFYDAFDFSAVVVLTEHCETNKFYDAFDAFGCNGHLVLGEH